MWWEGYILKEPASVPALFFKAYNNSTKCLGSGIGGVLKPDQEKPDWIRNPADGLLRLTIGGVIIDGDRGETKSPMSVANMDCLDDQNGSVLSAPLDVSLCQWSDVKHART